MADGNNLEELRELVDFLKANGIAEFDMERANLKVRIKFEGAAGAAGINPAQLAMLMASAGGGAPGQFAATAPAAAGGGRGDSRAGGRGEAA